MKRLLLLSFLSAVLLFSSNTTQGQYFTEDFETAFAGDPPAPTGWTQTMNRPVQHAAEKNWLQNTWTGDAWSVTDYGTKPVGAQSGTGVLWIDDREYSSTSNPQNSRRMESPSIDLTTSTSPYLRFWYFNNQGVGLTMNLRIMASADGGASWTMLTPIVNGFTTTANSWNRISVFIPSAYRTATFKFGFEITNRYGGSNPFIDNVSVEEFTPTTITSAATGDWNAGATWNGGVVPTADNHVVIAAGHTVTMPPTTGIIGRCQNLTVNGTLAHSTSTAVIVHAYGNVVVSGTLNAFNGSSGRAFYAGHNFTINAGGTANFSVGTIVQNTGSAFISTDASMLVFLGNQASSFTNNGTLLNGRINNVMHLNTGGHTYSSTVRVPYTFGLYIGAVNPNGNLTIGNRPESGVQSVETANGTFTTNPIWNNTNVTSRSNVYYSPNWVPLTQTTFTPGNEIELVGGVRTVSGTLTLNTHNNIQLGYPLAVGTAATGAGLNLNRGILITDAINILHLAQNNTSASAGAAPSNATPPTTHGSYISGPLKRTYPASGNTSRTFPLGVGTAFNGATPNANVVKAVTLATGATGASAQSPIVSIVGAPSGGFNAPLTAVMGTRAYRVNLDGGSDFPATATITIPAMNYTFGNSDDLIGAQQELRVGQATSLTGTWSERSTTSGTGAFVNNTNYPRTTATAAPGPIAPIATNGEYFALATTATDMIYTSSTTTQTNTNNVENGTPNAQVIGIQVVTNGSNNPFSLTKITVNANGTTNVADIENAKIFYTGSTNVFSTAAQFGSTFAAPTVSNFDITGSQTLEAGTNYFWLTFDVKVGATDNNLIDAECVQVTVGGSDYIPTITAPVGSRTIKLPWDTYDFSHSVGTYEALAGGTTIIDALVDDGNSAATNIGFDFVFNGTTFTQFVANSNGNIRLGSSPPTNQYNPISTTSNTNAISFFSRDGRTGDAVTYLLTGVAPDRVLTIEYPNWWVTYASDWSITKLNAQIKLYETTNVIKIIYGNVLDNNSNITAQVGIRGGTDVTEYSNRTTTTNWAATTAGTTSSSTVLLTSGVFPVSGTTFTWSLTNKTTWNGIADNNWSNIANWSNGSPLGGNAVIGSSANNPVLSVAATVNNITINNGAALNVSNIGQLTVNGTLTNYEGNSGLVLQSNATGTGSLMHNTNNVPATINRYLTGNALLTSKHYHQVSFPLNADITTNEFLGSYLWKWDYATQGYVSYGPGTDNNLPNNQGYLAFYPGASVTYDFTGQLNNGTFDVPLGANNADFTLAPNPYPSAINWNTGAGWTRTNLEGTYWIWSPLDGNYANYNGTIGTLGATEFIPAGQAFFVKANAGSPMLQLNNNARAHSNQAYLNTEQISNLLRITARANNFRDEMIVYFDQEALITLDEKDATKLLGAAEAPQLYSNTADSEKLSINVLPYAETTSIVPVGFEISETTETTLYFDGLQSFAQDVTIFLEDKMTDEMFDMRQFGQYTFQHNAGNDPDRFNLHFFGVTGLDDVIARGSHQIWSSDRKVYVNIPELNGQRASIEMFDVPGSRIYSSEGVLNSPAVIRAMNSGVAVVRVTAQGRVYTTKLFIQ